MPLIWIGMGLLLALLAGCAEGRWVQAGKTEAHTQDDWEQCKAEVLSGQEHRKDTMAGGINLSGCMQAKGYRYAEEAEARPTGPRLPRNDSLADREITLPQVGESPRSSSTE